MPRRDHERRPPQKRKRGRRAPAARRLKIVASRYHELISEDPPEWHREDDGAWEALFFHGEIGATVGHAVHAPTRLDVAEGALAKYLSKPWLGGSAPA